MTDTAEVLVVGAGLGGLSAAMFLARRGVRTVIVEKHPGTSIYPKAAGQNPRTMELLRIGGLLDQVSQANDLRGQQGDFTIRVAESVGGKVLHTFAESVDDMMAATAPCTPQGWGFLAQDQMEPILLAQAEKHGAVVRYGTELVSFEQGPSGVDALVRDSETGKESVVHADYLVAADGPDSPVRERLGISRHGHGVLSHFIGVIFEADLSAVLPPGSVGWYYLQNPAFTGNFGPTDKPNRHTFFVEYSPERSESPEDFPPSRCVELIRLAVNMPELEPKLLNIQQWEMAAHIADRWRDGRVFLVGDAAKVTPPTGGLGGNTAIGDGYDIAWKLAEVVKGAAGTGLLDSYEPERKQVAELVVDESMSVYAHRMAPHLIGTVPAGVGYAEVLLGFRYRSGAVLIDDPDPAPVEDPLRPSGRPGFRAPHVWITRAGSRMSTVDMVGEWMLIAADERWRGADARVHTFVVGTDFEEDDPAGRVVTRYGIGESGASLVRPDGIVAWRTASPVPGALPAVLDKLHVRQLPGSAGPHR
ncbi:FAD-dependent oxidoreductase [Prauserella marina]|uniref:Aklavinone 12-hydroxylase n=1 Tax=Prauserella marina TaxID=530584 RepID=A0A222VLU8_9PSEU|nr:FAD-dependent monooxygenase [Prauserella marina]ASR34864.1 FAD-dependent oxidoreductase [Prauserella marina]PWV85437.1 aklavinone 12-hydroxylase [Prauserella marina]SDC54837.1 aklavinone 12-hydroxylase [Prauserella marina]